MVWRVEGDTMYDTTGFAVVKHGDELALWTLFTAIATVDAALLEKAAMVIDWRRMDELEYDPKVAAIETVQAIIEDAIR